MVFAFSRFVDFGSVLMPEVDALWFALQQCTESRFDIAQIETTSSALIEILSDRSSIPWKLIYMIRKTKNHFPSDACFNKIGRNANDVAQALASLALASKDVQIFFHSSDLPSRAGQALLQDVRGLSTPTL